MLGGLYCFFVKEPTTLCTVAISIHRTRFSLVSSKTNLNQSTKIRNMNSDWVSSPYISKTKDVCLMSRFLVIYSYFAYSFGYMEYLNYVDFYEFRIALTKLRVSSHRPNIEWGCQRPHSLLAATNYETIITGSSAWAYMCPSFLEPLTWLWSGTLSWLGWYL